MKKSSSIFCCALSVLMMAAIVKTNPRPAVVRAEDGGLSVVYVNGSSAYSDDNDGTSSASAVKTMKKAYELVTADGTGTIVLSGNVRVQEELFPAKPVKITSKIGNEDYTSSAGWLFYSSCDSYFQADTYINDITFKTNMEGYGLVANGYNLHIGDNVNVTQLANGKNILLAGGRSVQPTDKEAVYKDGANLTVESGKAWLIFAAGKASMGDKDDVIENTETVNVHITGNAYVDTLVCGMQVDTQPDKNPETGKAYDAGVCKIGDVIADVDGSAIVKYAYCGSFCYSAGRIDQTENGKIVLNMGENTTFGNVYGGGQYVYHVNTENQKGQVQNLSNVEINYWGGALAGAITLGGVDGVYSTPGYKGSPTETIQNLVVNLHSDVDKIYPGMKQDIGAGLDDEGLIDVKKSTINLYNESTFTFYDLKGYDNIYPFLPEKRVVGYANCGSLDNPEWNKSDYNPTSIEFMTQETSTENTTNVFSTTSELSFENISTDDSTFTFVLKGDEVPVITATETVTSEGGNFLLSFVNEAGEQWIPELGTVVFQVPAVSSPEEIEALLEIFALEDYVSEEGIVLAYQEVEVDGVVIGQIVLAKAPDPAPLIAGYTIEYYIEQVDGSYVLADTVEGEGEIGSAIQAEVKAYDHYTLDANNENTVLTGEITEEGLTLKVYYTLDSYTITYVAVEYGDFGNDVHEITGTYKYGASLPKAPTPKAIKKYQFKGWIDLKGNTIESFPDKVTEDVLYFAIFEHLDNDSVIFHTILGTAIGAACVAIPLSLKVKED